MVYNVLILMVCYVIFGNNSGPLLIINRLGVQEINCA